MSQELSESSSNSEVASDTSPYDGSSGSDPAPQQTSESTRSQVKSSFMSKFFLLLAILASTGALLASAYLWQELQTINKKSEQQLALSAQVESSNNKITSLNESLDAKDQALRDQQQAVENLQAELTLMREKLANISGVNRVDWLVDELQHLTRLAHQRLVLSNDAQGAIALLTAADQVVVEIRQSSALGIRQAIASDLVDLRLVGENDLEGAYIRLGALGEKLEKLTFKTLEFPQEHLLQENAKQEEYIGGDIEDRLFTAVDHVLAKLQPYLYRSFRVDGEIKPLLNTNERQYLNRNLLIAIEQAQLALLRRENASYQQSLNQLESWIIEYYDNGDPVTSSVLNMVKELKSYQLNPTMPEINKTLDAVKAFSDEWQSDKMGKPKLKRNLGASLPSSFSLTEEALG